MGVCIGDHKIHEARKWHTASGLECLVVEGWHSRFLKVRDVVWGLVLYEHSRHVRSIRACAARSCGSCIYTRYVPNLAANAVGILQIHQILRKSIATLMLLLLSHPQVLPRIKRHYISHPLCIYCLMHPAPSNCSKTKSMPIQWPRCLIRDSSYHVSHHSASFLFPSAFSSLRYFMTYSYVSRTVVAAGTARIMFVPIPA
jgi:hypothetical protein